MFSFHTLQTAEAELFLLHTKKKYGLVYLEEHVSRFYSPISGHSSSFHDGADVNAAVSSVVALTNNTDTQKVVLLCQGKRREWERSTLKQNLCEWKQILIIRFTHVEGDGDDVEAHRGVRDTAEGWRLRKAEKGSSKAKRIYAPALSSVSYFRRGTAVSWRGSPGLFWPLCASVCGACVAASAVKKNSVQWSYWAWNRGRGRK